MLNNKFRMTKYVPYIILFFFVLFSVFPLFWIYSSSIRSYGDVYTRKITLIPRSLNFNAYITNFIQTPFLLYLKNSVITSLLSTIIAVSIGAMCAYSISHSKSKIILLFGKLILLVYMLPKVVMMIPIYRIINILGLVNTRMGLVLAYVSFAFPFATWLLASYFNTLPEELEEAALIDGATNLKVFIKIILPLSSPALVTVSMFAFITSFNEFLYALIITNSDKTKTLTVGLYSLYGGEVAEWPRIMAWVGMIIIPSLIFFMTIQNRIVSGLTGGAVKG